MIIDFRSDTFTRPTPGMLDAMYTAATGDDVYGEDPSVNKLEAMMAAFFGKEAALYCPTGTMSNQIAIKVHTQPGDEVIHSPLAHVYVYEGGGIAATSGAQSRFVEGDRGMITAAGIAAVINPDDIHKANTSLVCLENTMNRGGGCCYDMEEIIRIHQLCNQHHLKLHLDGARLFNALVATGHQPATYGALFDSLSVCLNKGMGCPMGSLLIGDQEFIKKARRVRKRLGGGMRQAGYMAATGIYAMENHIERLADDHHHAKQLANALLEKPFIGHMLPVETNIISFELVGEWTARYFCDFMKNEGILMNPVTDNAVRMVTHLDITPDMVAKTCKVIAEME